MPGELRAVVMLFYMQGMDTRAVSESLGIPVGTVKSRLSRARDHLRRIIGDSR
jgi:RNA polymerase sigma-70 factor (ECF subfamily)